MPSVSSRALCAALERNGFVLKRQKGSHRIYARPDSSALIIVPMHSHDLKNGTAHAILKQAGLSFYDV